MPLHQADILLYRARLFRDRAALAEARCLIEKHGYHRRDEELADAEAAAVNWKDKEPSMPTKAFISYSHDNEQHSQRVLALANQLRAQGVDAEIDQYETRPPQGWPRWCEEKLRPENSELVLVICTETYLKRIEGKVPADEGRGVFWEGDVIYNYIYNQKSKGRFLPVIFDRKDEEFIPIPLQGATRYFLTDFDLSDSGYEALYRELTHQPAVQRPPLGEVVTLRRGGVSFERSVSDTQVLPPVAPREVRSTFPSSTEENDKPVVDQVFISYCESDTKFLNEFLTQLKPYLRSGSITAWSDSQIAPGSKWLDEVQAALNRACVAVLLVSPSFLASDFIDEHELTPILRERTLEASKSYGFRFALPPIWKPLSKTINLSSLRQTGP